MSFRSLFAATVLTTTGLSAWADAPVQIDAPWARATVAGQQATGAFMRITAQEPLQLVGVSTPAAALSEVHEMKMEGDVMRMRAIESLPLPAGQSVELKPGGYHLMFMQLKAPLQAGSTVPVTLQLTNAQGQRLEHTLQVPVQQLARPAGAGAHPSQPLKAAHEHQHEHEHNHESAHDHSHTHQHQHGTQGAAQ